MSDVVAVECRSYDTGLVKKAVEKGLNLLGGVGRFAKPADKILLKPNLLVAEKPEKCVTTHPSIFRAVAELFSETGAKLSFGDSPAFGSTEKVARKAGLLEVATELGIEVADFKNGEEIFFEKGVQNRKFTVAKGALSCDGIISLPKLKTHALERMTGAIKNQFGCIPGALKGEFHLKLPDAHQFGKMLVDLNNYLKPRLYIMDGIQGMEGNGPRGGKPVDMNVILLSTDPVALDATVCRLVGLNPEYVPTIKYGCETGAGVYVEEEIRLLGDDLTKLKTDSFDVKKRPIRSFQPGKRGLRRVIHDQLIPKPIINSGQCNGCGTCVSMCPAKPRALIGKKGNTEDPPVYDYDECIRCYCCQEVCPEGAIYLAKPIFRRVLGLFS
jgi:uncharacterized protein (DUF362 family)/NAD-dependent dihydropyrimidine dehydrogenase PreA subunit